MSKRKYVYFEIPLSIKKEYSSNTKNGESEIKQVQIGKSGNRFMTCNRQNKRGGTEYQTAVTTCEENTMILQ